MDRTDFLLAARDMLTANAGRVAGLARAVPDLGVPLGGGSAWTARDALAHLVVGTDDEADVAAGTAEPVGDAGREAFAAWNAQRIADVTESDPGKLAALYEAAVDRFLARTQPWPADRAVAWHGGLTLDLASLTGTVAAEALLHGYDIACALGVPWPIEPSHAQLTIGAYAPLLPAVVNTVTTAGLTAAYGLTVRGGAALTVRFTDGAFALEPPGLDADCEVSVDPVAFVLVLSGRLSRWPAIALGLIAAGGRRPELAAGFPDLFSYP